MSNNHPTSRQYQWILASDRSDPYLRIHGGDARRVALFTTDVVSMRHSILRLAGLSGMLIGTLALTQAPYISARAATADTSLDERARAIHRHVLTLDSHVDVLVPGAVSEYGPGHPDQADLQKLKSGGIDAVALAIAVGPGPLTAEGVAAARSEANAKLAVIQGFIRDNPAEVALALSAEDVRKIHKEGKIAVIESFLNARSLGADLNGIDEFHAAGVRLFGFVHAGNNAFADSSRPLGNTGEEFHGLSPLGKEAVAKLNRLGIIIDISQLTPDGVFEALKLSQAPVVASHSAVRSLVDNTRNLSDAELDAIKLNGGVVQVTAFNAYLVPRPGDYREKVRTLRVRYGLSAEFSDSALGYFAGADALSTEHRQAFIHDLAALYPKASVKDYVDHIEYVIKRIGIDHVGIGTDFNHGAGIEEFQDESEALNVTRELVRRGYTEAQIAKIWGGNFLRVFSQVEIASQRLQKP
jgi:membrane dipeptidase